MSCGILEFDLSEKEWLELVRESKGIEKYRKSDTSTNNKREER